MHVVFIGRPGAGKGTQAQRLADATGMAHLSTGEMLRTAMKSQTAIGLRVEPYMKGGQFVPDDVILELITQRLDDAQCEAGYILDGFPRTIAQAEVFDAWASRHGTSLDLVVELYVSEDELFERLASRGRSDDTPAIIRQRLIDYHQETEPLFEYYGRKRLLKTVDGAGSVDQIHERILELLEPYRKPASSSRLKSTSPGTTGG